MSDLLLKQLASIGCRGPVITPGSADYDRARQVWNGVSDRRPAAVLRAADVDDVRKAIDVAANCNAVLAIRGGGHSLPGLSTCDGGLLLDLSQLNSARLDISAGTVEAGGGALLRDLDAATVPSGFVVPAGVVSHTGVAGLTLGGGMGRVSRAYGLTIDSLIGVEIVTADGSVNWIDAAIDPELFWGIRGGGGNFGVITRFRFRLHQLGPVAVGHWTYPMADAQRAITGLGDLARQRPREFSVAFTLARGGLIVTAVWVGDSRRADQMLSPFGELAGVGEGEMGAMPFLHLQSRNDAHFAWSRRYYAKGGFWSDISGHVVDAMLEQIASAPTMDCEFYITQLGGAVADVREGDTAYSGRQAGYYWIAEPVWDDPADDERCIEWGRFAAGRLADRSIAANYVNEQSDTAIASGAYGAIKYDRLRHLKTRLDSSNLFRLNQNILPFAATPE
ncbi:MAG: FAD-binding oxidoreductase [Mesorhizobium sp.]|nr:MAG: FAD-binding oxidoreductase [Mesorhizobium sp.]RWN73297.1 MAG: FAD-binding oxidoreductase [Mesorhizobium sp.]RWN75309.1 MAG: FAD-binding oxidoreductase [Mesorhizobium sp.]RWN84031.1 MAG: FAD-binding oxidoreductase [Mesorhizobium sp.]RWO10832.1 MAG: FAD-binding oxidoreductase [Mesorhizobium sp.]